MKEVYSLFRQCVRIGNTYNNIVKITGSNCQTNISFKPIYKPCSYPKRDRVEICMEVVIRVSKDQTKIHSLYSGKERKLENLR